MVQSQINYTYSTIYLGISVENERLEAQAKREERQAVYMANYEKTPERQVVRCTRVESMSYVQ